MNYEKSTPTPNSFMETLGGFFQRARERQGLSLDQVASQTRIQPRHLQALEEEDYESLPAKVFTKGFVRSYARALGLDENEALQLFLVSSGSFYKQNTTPEPQHVQLKLEPVHQRPFINWKLGLILLLVIGGAFFLLQSEQPENSPPPREPATLQTSKPGLAEPPANVPPAAPVESEPPLVSTLPAPPSPVSPPVATLEAKPLSSNSAVSPHSENVVTSDGPLVLEIEATQLTWVVVQSDSQPPHEALLQPGQRVRWEAQDQYVLTLGNAAGVVVRLNGESQGPFGKPGEVVRNILLKPKPN